MATIEGASLYYEVHGQGPPLVLLSETAGTAEYWKLAQVPAFHDRYTVILHDYRGAGRSSRPAERYSTRGFAADVVALLSEIGVRQPAHVVGHSMGGRVAQWLALDSPGSVRSLVLAASGSGNYSGSAPRTSGIPPQLVLELVEHGWPGLHEVEVRGRYTFAAPSAELVEAYAAAQRGQFSTDLASYLRHVVARQEHETSSDVHRIAAPCLVVVGEEDNLTGVDPEARQTHVDSSKYLADNIPDATFVSIPGVAHALHVEGAEMFNRVVGDFLCSH